MLNKVVLIGRFTKDPELRTTPQGVSTCSFTLAVDRNFQSKDGERQTDFINCVAWRNSAEFISKYFNKGNLVAVEGSIQTRSWDDPADGKRRYATDVVISQAYFVESKRDSQSRTETAEASTPYSDLPEPIAPIGTDDDLPF